MAMQMLQYPQKSFCVSLLGSNFSLAPQLRSDPARNIEPVPMLTGGGDPQALPWLRPAKAQSGMQGKARFVLKDHGLIRLQGAEFFLSLAETSPLLRSWPASTSNWPVSCGSPIGASTAGLVVPSALSQTVASNASPGSARPNALGLTQRTGRPDPGVFAAPFRLCCSVGKG